MSTAVKAYVSAEPWILGLFHWGAAAGESDDTLKRAGHLGVIARIGPCSCADPTHLFPKYYRITPCVFARAFGHILTMRISMRILRAILWIEGSSDL
jgi:hypothetical protein